MKLVHYSAKSLGPLRAMRAPKGCDFFKPHGLWVSDEDCETNWHSWCVAEDFCPENLSHAHDIELADSANILFLRSAQDIDAFTREWQRHEPISHIPWSDVQRRYDGIIITPYIWGRRLSGDARWYYPWDCASGCIWNPRAIASVVLRAPTKNAAEVSPDGALW